MYIISPFATSFMSWPNLFTGLLKENPVSDEKSHRFQNKIDFMNKSTDIYLFRCNYTSKAKSPENIGGTISSEIATKLGVAPIKSNFRK